MPHINRIRVNNVKYNFGTQFYDDFMMRFSCKNTIYDLANGGGKSVLMLLLLQNLIPNCTLDDKQPIEKLFRTNEGSTTIHSLIEWRLSDIHIHDNYKYMLTGFCARKAKDSGEINEAGELVRNGSAIEYFNYVIFYRKFNDNDIKNLPLIKNGERITYTGLRSYLKELEKKDMSLEVKIFDRKGDYQRFIAGYGLYESEWEIIRGINKTEGHVRTYFETNYKTTRKVVEDLLIEEIIEKSFANNYLEEGAQDKLAQTLLDIKDKLLELSRKKDEIHNYDRQAEIIGGFIDRAASIRQLYLGMADTFTRLKRVYNSVLEEQRNCERNRSVLESNRDDVLNERKNLGKKVETAKVLLEKKELGKLERKLAELEQEYDSQVSEQEALTDQLNVMEGGNHYLEYVEAKREYDKLLYVIDNMLRDNGELLSKLREAVAVKKMVDEETKRRLSEEIERELNLYDNEIVKIDELEKKVREFDNEMAVTEYELGVSEKRIEEINSEISRLKADTSLLLPSDAVHKCREKELEVEETLHGIEELKQELERANDKELELKLEYQRCDDELRKATLDREKLQNRNKKLLNSEEKLKKLKEVYQEENLAKLCDKIEKAYKSMILRLEKEKRELEETELYLDSLKSGKPIRESESLKNVLAYIVRYHTHNAVSGAEYLAGLEENVRIEVLRNNPILPYAVIVYDKAEQIAGDWELAKRMENGVFIPIINAGEKFDERITDGNIIDYDEFICMLGSTDKFKQENITAFVHKTEAALAQQRKSYERKSENEGVIGEDYLFVKLVTDGLIDDEQINPSHRMKEIEESIKNLSAKMDMIQKGIYDNGYNKEMLAAEIERREKQIKEVQKEQESLTRIAELLEEYRELEQKMRQSSNSMEGIKREYGDNIGKLEAMKNMNTNRDSRIKQAKEEIEQLEKTWNEKYASYYDETIYQTVAMDRPKGIEELLKKLFQSELKSKDYDSGDGTAKEQIDVIIEGLFMALKKDNSSVTDKEKLLNNYQISMQRSLQRIDYLGLETAMFDNMLVNRDLHYASSHDMNEIRKKSSDLKKQGRELKRKIDEKRSERDKKQGSIGQAISMIEKNYGVYDEMLVKSEEIHTFMNENGRLLQQIEEQLAEYSRRIKANDESVILLSVLKRDSERLMEKSDIQPDVSLGVLSQSDVKVIEEEYHKVANELDKFIHDKFKRSEEFERELSLLIETLKKLGADELASEMRMNIEMPSDTEEVDELIGGLKETNVFIELEKQRVIKGLQDIQMIKDNFEKQCIQSCVNIKTELDRLSRLSRITIDDENIAIINLKIPYISEELYRDRMSDYIDKIAERADEYEKPEEKLKFIRNNLCWKKMFSVIVTDMNAIRLNLYKRERIASQSRYLPYEEAVGSTGQSQGIYIQFLISIINYISSINSKNADATGLRKVIFIDNPFGAAKDIYIWEPIFKLLRTNNVQLIVPARGATPAITGRFDVNYILGQKVCDGKQQTVVVDYYSNVKGEELDYTTLSFEQTALF